MPYELIITAEDNPSVPPGIYDPIAALGTDLIAMFDVEEAGSVTVDANGKITSWASRVGALVLVPFDQAYKPAIVIDGWAAGQPCVRFTAGGGITGTVLTNTAGPLNDAGMTAFVVARRGAQLAGTATRIRPVLQLPAALESGLRQQGLLGVVPPEAGVDPEQTLIAGGNFTGGGAQTNNSTVSGFLQGRKGLLYGEFPNSDAIRVRLDGGAQGAAKPWYDVPNAATWSLGGARNFADASFGGDVLLVLVIRGVPDAELRQKLEGYCMWRAGIQAQLPVAHPFLEDGPYAA